MDLEADAREGLGLELGAAGDVADQASGEVDVEFVAVLDVVGVQSQVMTGMAVLMALRS